MKTVVSESYVRSLFSKKAPKGTPKDASHNSWLSATEAISPFCFCAMFLLVVQLIKEKAFTTVCVTFAVVFSILLIGTVFVAIKAIQFSKRLKRLAWDITSDFTYEIVDGTFIERTNHGYDSTGSGFSYEFKIKGEISVFSDMVLLGKRHPTDEFFVVKIVFRYPDERTASRIYAFNKAEYEVNLPEGNKRSDLFDHACVGVANYRIVN